jgi:hypothetical protein
MDGILHVTKIKDNIKHCISAACCNPWDIKTYFMEMYHKDDDWI